MMSSGRDEVFMTKLELTEKQVKGLREILEWKIVECYDMLDVETDEDTRQIVKDEMKVSNELLEMLDIHWGVLKKFFLRWRRYEGKKGLKKFAKYLGKTLGGRTS